MLPQSLQRVFLRSPLIRKLAPFVTALGLLVMLHAVALTGGRGRPCGLLTGAPEKEFPPMRTFAFFLTALSRPLSPPIKIKSFKGFYFYGGPLTRRLSFRLTTSRIPVRLCRFGWRLLQVRSKAQRLGIFHASD